jgi:hypothetical protein
MDLIDGVACDADAIVGRLVERLVQSAEAGENDLSSFADEHKAVLNGLKTAVAKANDEFAVDEERDNVPETRPKPPFPMEHAVRALCAPSVETLSRRFRGGVEEDSARSSDEVDNDEENTVGDAPIRPVEKEQEENGVEGEEEEGRQENVAPNLADDTVFLEGRRLSRPRAAHEQPISDALADDNSLVTTRKRGRAVDSAPPADSPPKRGRGTKLKAAFEAGESRRTTRRTSSRRPA